jgi:transposase
VLAIERINDVDQLRQVASLLDRECDRLLTRNQELLRELAKLKGEDATQSILEEVARLELQNAKLERMIFARSSERRPHEDVAPAEEQAPPKKGHGPRAQPELPLREVVHELPAEDRTCPKCQGELRPWDGQFETSEEVTIVRRRYEILRHRRQKYACRCTGDLAIVTAPGPGKLVPGGRYSTEFAVEVACDKYLNHLPLDRQRKMMRREGLLIDTQTLWDQVEAVADALRPLHEALRQRVLASPLLHADETRWSLIKAPEAERWQDWCIACEDAVHHRILPSRSAEAGSELLGGYRGVAMVDGYVAYEAVARGQPGLSLAHCWAHVRRKFVEIETFYPKECEAILDLIGQLYKVERVLPSLSGLEGAERDRALEIRLAVRREQSRPIVKAILDWIPTLQLTRESALRKTVEYMTDRWQGLTRFLDDARVPLDNNLLERALRPVALGRKNHLGSKSERGIEATAILYSVIETAKLAGVDPHAYMLAAVRAALETPRRILLPRDLKR